MGMFRALRADEVEARVATCSEKGASLLLYKTSRTDMALLDETVGPERWQCRYEEVKGALNCSLGLYVEPGDGSAEWIWKQAAGSPSNMEAEKGESSDALKRAGFLWGIGRELYTAPFVWVPADRLKRLNNRNGRWQCYDRFDVAEFEVEQGRIAALAIVREGTSDVVYRWHGAKAGGHAEKGKTAPQSAPQPVSGTNQPASDQQTAAIAANAKRLADVRGVGVEVVMRSVAQSKAAQRAGVREDFGMLTDAQAQVVQMVLTGWLAKAEQ